MTNTRTLHRLNKLYRHLGSWSLVAHHCLVGERTIRKWFSGEIQTITPLSADLVRIACEREGL